MNKITITKVLLKHISKDKLNSVVPLKVTVDNKDEFVISRVSDVIDVSDLHPRVRIALKAQEEKARKGMPTKTIQPDELVDFVAMS